MTTTAASRVGRATYVLLAAKGLDMFDTLDALPFWQRVCAVKMYHQYGPKPLPDEMASGMICDPLTIRKVIESDALLSMKFAKTTSAAQALAADIGIVETLNLMSDSFSLMADSEDLK